MKLRISLLFVGVSTAMAGQITVTPVVIEGDVFPQGTVSSGFGASENLAINNQGDWIIETTFVGGLNALVTGNRGGAGTVIWMEGDALTAPVGATLSSFDSVNLNNSGNSAFNLFLDNAGDFDSGVYFNMDLLVREGDVATPAGLSPGTPYIGWFEAKVNDDNQVVMMASVDDPALASTTDRAIVRVDDPEGAATQVLISAEGAELLPGRFVVDFSTGPHNLVIRDSGIAFMADLDGDALNDGVIMRHDGTSNTVLAREGDPSAVSGRNWGTLIGVPIDMNNRGDWVMRGDLDGATTDDSLIVRNGVEVIAREGSGLAAIGAFTFTSFGTGAVLIDDGGRVIWFGDWNDPVTTQDTGIFVDDQLVVQEGVTQTVDGDTIFSISGVQDNLAVSPNGRYILFEGVLEGDISGTFLVEISAPCPGDLDGDGDVDLGDLGIILSDYGCQGPDCVGDIDGDGETGLGDLGIVLAGFGEPCR